MPTSLTAESTPIAGMRIQLDGPKPSYDCAAAGTARPETANVAKVAARKNARRVARLMAAARSRSEAPGESVSFQLVAPRRTGQQRAAIRQTGCSQAGQH